MFRRSDALECIEVFLVAYTCFNLNLAKQATALYVHSPLLKTQLRKLDSMMNLLCSKVKIIFALKFD
jgi:hypothetical protein